MSARMFCAWVKSLASRLNPPRPYKVTTQDSQVARPFRDTPQVSPESREASTSRSCILGVTPISLRLFFIFRWMPKPTVRRMNTQVPPKQIESKEALYSFLFRFTYWQVLPWVEAKLVLPRSQVRWQECVNTLHVGRASAYQPGGCERPG